MVDQDKETVTSETETEEEKDTETKEEENKEMNETDNETKEPDKEEEDETEKSSEEELEPTELREKLKELEEKYEALEAEKKQLTDRMLRIQADYENYKRRTEKERIAERKYKAQDLATELLPVIDNFERALQTEVTEENKSFRDGMVMIYEQLQNALKSQGIETIETVNKPFDPNIHHAVMQVEDENFESNVIVEELQKGYILKDKVIRPAMVKVNK